MKKEIIKVDNVSKVFQNQKDKITAVSNISFSLKEGEDLVIIGPSGSGKTTLLQIMSGLSRPTKGEVLVNGTRIDKGPDREISKFRNKTMGFVFQNIYLQSYLTALENVMVPMLIGGIKRKKAKDKAVELLKSVGLEKRINFKPSRLSGGEEQRVAIARALAMGPKILFADEPTAKLDSKNTDIILEIIKDVNKTGVCIVVITHDKNVAKNFSRHLYLEHGEVTDRNF